MDFECDPEKAQVNLDKHGVGFAEAITVFGDPLEVTERRAPTVVVAYTERGTAIRIISAREAMPRERKTYEGPDNLTTR